MARVAPSSALGNEFDGFLFASVHDDATERLSVLSTLARLDLDPWQTAATLAALPQADAVQRLASLFSGLPDGLANREAIAMRLVAFLPTKARASAGAHNPPVSAGTGVNPRADSIWLIYIVWMLVMLGAQSLAQGQPTTPEAHAASPPATGAKLALPQRANVSP